MNTRTNGGIPMKTVSPASLEIMKRMQQNELTESVIYEEIARFAKGEENKQVLLRLAREERAHYEIWKKYTGISMQPERAKMLPITIFSGLRMSISIESP